MTQVQRISNPPLSTAQPPLRAAISSTGRTLDQRLPCFKLQHPGRFRKRPARVERPRFATALRAKFVFANFRRVRLFDAHCHLQDERLPDTDAVLRRAYDAGVERLSCCGSAEADWPDVLRMAQEHPCIVPSFGLHPYYVGERTAAWDQILRKYLETVPSGVGEAGLDHALEPRDDAAQEEVFRIQIQIARDLRRPISVHCRRAWDRMISFLEQVGPPSAGVIFHAYSGGAEQVPRLVELGGFFSFSGSLTRSGNKRGRRAAAAAPADRLLVETDAPDMPPVIGGTAPSVNEPANLVYVVRTLAEVRGTTAEEIADLTWENACRVFAFAG